MKIIDCIIRSTIISTTFLVSAIITGIQSFLSLVQQFNYLGQHQFDLWKIFLYVLMQLPAQFYQLFPIAGFLGALIALSRLASTSQLIVMRASGVSIMQITWSVMKTAFVMIIVVTVIGEGVGPVWQQQSEQMRQRALYPPTHASSVLDSIWLHQGNSFTYIGELNNRNKMIDVTRFRFEPDGHLKQASFAPLGQLVDDQWQLSGLKKTIFHRNHIAMTTEERAQLHVTFQPKLQIQMSIASAEQTLVNLYHTIYYRESVGLGVNQFIFTFCQRILQPLTTVIMICLAVPFVFGSSRSASMSLRIMTGVLIGFIFYMLNQLFGPITLVYQFPPLLAAVMPSCLFLFIAMVLLLKTR